MATKAENLKQLQAEKQEEIRKALADLDKDFGKGTVVRIGDRTVPEPVEAISTGSVTTDIATGIGGLPRGRIVEIYGPESAGKTTICLQTIREAQKEGGICAFIDMEHALDTDYAADLGVDVDNLYIAQPDYGEQALAIVERLARSGVYSVIVLDSVAALVPKKELDGDMGDSSIGLHARLMSQAMRKLTGVVSRSNTLLIMTNQLRMKIGVMFGNPEVTTGGESLKFYASMRLDVRRSTQIKDGEEVLGNLTTIKIVKNKCAPPFKKASFNILYGRGVDNFSEVIDVATDLEILTKSGSWYSYNESKIGQGKDAVAVFLNDNPELYEEIKTKVFDKVIKKPAVNESAAESGIVS